MGDLLAFIRMRKDGEGFCSERKKGCSEGRSCQGGILRSLGVTWNGVAFPLSKYGEMIGHAACQFPHCWESGRRPLASLPFTFRDHPSHDEYSRGVLRPPNCVVDGMFRSWQRTRSSMDDAVAYLVSPAARDTFHPCDTSHRNISPSGLSQLLISIITQTEAAMTRDCRDYMLRDNWLTIRSLIIICFHVSMQEQVDGSVA